MDGNIKVVKKYKSEKEMMKMTVTVKQLKEMVYEVNSYDGSLEDFDYRDMGALNEVLYETKPIEILRMAHFGNFEWQDEMFKINVYGNLDSCSEDYFITELIDNSKEITERYKELVEAGDIEPIE